MLNKRMITELFTKKNLFLMLNGLIAGVSAVVFFGTIIFTEEWQNGDQNFRKAFIALGAIPVIFGLIPSLKDGSNSVHTIFIIACLWVVFWVGAIGWGYGPTL